MNKSDILSMRNINNWKQNQTLEAFNATFRKQTFDLNDILINMTYSPGSDYDSILSFKVGQTEHKGSLVEIIEVYSDRGRCYSIYTSNIISIEEVIRLEFISSR